MKYTAIRNVFKKHRNDPEFVIFQDGDYGKKAGVMYKRRGRNGLTCYQLYIYGGKDERFNSAHTADSGSGSGGV